MNEIGNVVKEKLVMLLRRFVLFAQNSGVKFGKVAKENARAPRFGNLDLAPSITWTLASRLLSNSPLNGVGRGCGKAKLSQTALSRKVERSNRSQRPKSGPFDVSFCSYRSRGGGVLPGFPAFKDSSLPSPKIVRRKKNLNQTS